MSFKMGLGATPWWGFNTILVLTPRRDCESSPWWISCLTKNSYQRLYFRNVNHPISKPSVVTRRQGQSLTSNQAQSILEHSDQDADRRYISKSSIRSYSSLARKSHIFNGRTINQETAAFQLCDIHDPMLKTMIENSEDLRDVCHVRRNPDVSSTESDTLTGKRWLVQQSCFRKNQGSSAT